MQRIIVIATLVVSVIVGALLAKGNLFTSGKDAFYRKDYATAFHKLKSDSTPEGQFLMGSMYLDGLGVRRDKQLASRYFLNAAQQGHREAQFAIGAMLSKGDGVPQDKAAAVRWYKTAGEAGHTKALFNLAIMYGTGDGVPKDEMQALRCMQKAAELGDVRAQEFLQKMRPPHP